MADAQSSSPAFDTWAPPAQEDDYQAPPHNIEAEQALLGNLLLQNAVYDRISDYLMPEHFFDALHGRIYAACGEVIKSGRTATPITIKGYFEQDEAMSQIGGVKYLARLVGGAATGLKPEDYATVIVETSIRRGLIEIAQRLSLTAFEAPIDKTPQEMAEQAESELTELVTRSASNTDMRSIGLVAEGAINTAAESYQNGVPIGLSTGLPSADELIGPMTPGAVIVIGGSTSMGKTALAEQIADWNAEQGNVVAFFSLEMMAEELAARSIAKLARVPAWRIESGKFSEEEFARIWDAKSHFSRMPLYIEDKRGLKVGQIRSRALRLKRRKGLHLLVIDHLQFIRSDNDRGQPSAQLEQITRDVKAMAGDLGVPVILISHLSREAAKRDDNRPRLSDLHGSSGIEKDADVVLFVHRPEYYLERAAPVENTPEWLAWTEAMEKWRGKAELIVAKRRKGKGSGTRRLNFKGDFTYFSEIDDAPALTQEEIDAQEALAL